MKKLLCVILSLTIMLMLFGCTKNADDTKVTSTTVSTTKAPVLNPLTGESNYNAKAVNVRPVAIVVENLQPARPQWGIESPDIIVEGEVEGGISRMLWLYADYTKVPDKVGPIRSARPSFIQFSELFDSIYIHWGGSHSKSDYVGGYETIEKDGVDDIDGMNGGKLFSRDSTRNVSSEHRGILVGSNLPQAIADKKYRTTIDNGDFSKLSFNNKTKHVGTDTANTVDVKFSVHTDTRKFTYSDSDKKYHTSDWETDVAFENLVVLSDTTTYITTPYKGSSTTYLNYSLKEGTGYLISNGTKTPLNWNTTSGQLVLSDDSGKQINLNKGKTYFGLASSNNGGSIQVG